MTVSRWPLERLKHVADVAFSSVDKKSVEDEVQVKLCNYTDVYYSDKITADMPFMEATASLNQVRSFRLRAGDVLITKDSETADDIGIAAFVPESLDGVVCGYHLAILRPRLQRIDPEYLFWSICCAQMREQMTTVASGVTRYGLRFADVGSLQLFVPDLDSQRAVAQFLDRETARIDALVALKLTAVQLLGKRRLSLLRKSLLPRIGEDVLGANDLVAHGFPDGWRAAPLKHVTEEFIPGGTPRTEEPRYWSITGEDGFPWVAISDMVERGTTMVTSKRVTAEGLAASRLRLGSPGTILLAMYASVGKTSVLGISACWNQAILGIVPRPNLVLPTFISYWLELARPYFMGIVRSNTQDNLNAEQVANLRVPLPPLSEQLELVRNLEASFADLDRLTARIEEQVRLLREHRQALITAAVTGQFNGSGELA